MIVSRCGPMTEQAPGTLVMLPFLLLAQPGVDLPEPEPQCSMQRGGTYIGRDSDGVPEFEYNLEIDCDDN